MEEILTRFEERREELGISLKQAEAETRIRIDYLKAIEEGDFDYIEAEVYLRGFLKVYSTYLGLDTREVLEAYKKLQEPEFVEEEVIKKESLKERVSKLFDEHQNIVLISCLIGTALLVIGFLTFVGVKLYGLADNRIANSSPSVEIAQKKEDVMLSDNEKGQEIVKKKERININQENNLADEISIQVETIDDSWYSVKVDGKMVFKGSVAANDNASFSGKEIELKIGNAAGVRVIKDNQVMGPFGSRGEVIVKHFSIKGN